ncbi:T9SS type A sorting domain-containing protein [Hymenobacter sp. M29]|uniref:T9SS type A sorting domain-containing protein n=1 Tax=Hymenobacter mellowenesis TaxID=3063995 RepID=A0ABT9AGJ5_9BACT|nr:T9SS type A sorting domain-containing protein [Hymenobacter sp. M29]MDO7848993.1 T9SS type A sorting domain-containing protein [Hymenobacter sp. M29]
MRWARWCAAPPLAQPASGSKPPGWPGIYTVRLSTGAGTLTKRVVVQ